MAKNGLESNPLWQMIEEIAQGGSATVEAPEQRNAITKDIYEAHLKHVYHRRTNRGSISPIGNDKQLMMFEKKAKEYDQQMITALLDGQEVGPNLKERMLFWYTRFIVGDKEQADAYLTEVIDRKNMAAIQHTLVEYKGQLDNLEDMLEQAYEKSSDIRSHIAELDVRLREYFDDEEQFKQATDKGRKKLSRLRKAYKKTFKKDDCTIIRGKVRKITCQINDLEEFIHTWKREREKCHFDVQSAQRRIDNYSLRFQSSELAISVLDAMAFRIKDWYEDLAATAEHVGPTGELRSVNKALKVYEGLRQKYESYNVHLRNSLQLMGELNAYIIGYKDLTLDKNKGVLQDMLQSVKESKLQIERQALAVKERIIGSYD